MTYDRYYYSLMTDSEKAVYKDIYHGLEKHMQQITINRKMLHMHSLGDIVQYINLDNPHLYYVNFADIRWQETSVEAVYRPNYYCFEAGIGDIDQKLQNILRKILSRVHGQTDFERESAVHDMLASNILYDDTDLKTSLGQSVMNHTILGVFFGKKAVCEGIAKAVKFLLNLLDIHCIVAVGQGMDNESSQEIAHAWNIVQLGGRWYHLDVTWDVNLSIEKQIAHDYMNITDAEALREHSWIERFPSCNSIEMNYYFHNGLTVMNINDAKVLLQRSIGAQSRFLEMKYCQSKQGSCEMLFSQIKMCADAVFPFTPGRQTIFRENKKQGIISFLW